MKLTKEQLRKAAYLGDTNCDEGCDCEYCTAVAALDAYERVAALAVNYRTMAVLDDADRQRNLRMAERIEDALYGAAALPASQHDAELLALAEQVCAQPPSAEPPEQWAKRLAGELVEDGCAYDAACRVTPSALESKPHIIGYGDVCGRAAPIYDMPVSDLAAKIEALKSDVLPMVFCEKCGCIKPPPKPWSTKDGVSGPSSTDPWCVCELRR